MDYAIFISLVCTNIIKGLLIPSCICSIYPDMYHFVTRVELVKPFSFFLFESKTMNCKLCNTLDNKSNFYKLI